MKMTQNSWPVETLQMGYTFRPKIPEKDINFEEKLLGIVRQAYILLGNRPNFVVEDMI